MGGDRLASNTNGERHMPVHGLRSPLATGLAAQAALPGGAAQTQKLNVIKTDTNMTTLDLNAYGVTEMSHAEKVDNNGGMGFLAGLAIGLAIDLLIEVISDSDQAKADFKSGYEKGKFND